MAYVYIVRGSEDGPLAVYTGHDRAIRRAKGYLLRAYPGITSARMRIERCGDWHTSVVVRGEDDNDPDRRVYATVERFILNNE